MTLEIHCQQKFKESVEQINNRRLNFNNRLSVLHFN